MKKRILSIALFFVLLVSCGETDAPVTGGTDNEGVTSTENVVTSPFDAFPTADFGRSEFHISSVRLRRL